MWAAEAFFFFFFFFQFLSSPTQGGRMDSERIELLDWLVQTGIASSTQDVPVRQRVVDEIKLDIEQERETRESTVRQLESLLTTYHPAKRVSETTPPSGASPTPIVFVNGSCFGSFSEIFLKLVESCRYEVELLRTLYRISHFFIFVIRNRDTVSESQLSLTSRVTMKSLIVGLHTWNNIPFWLDTHHDLCRYDMLIVEKLYNKKPTASTVSSSGTTSSGSSSSNPFDDFCGLTKNESMALIILTRAQSVIASMRSLGLTKESIDAFSVAVGQKFKLEEFNIDGPSVLSLSVLSYRILTKTLQCILAQSPQSAAAEDVSKALPTARSLLDQSMRGFLAADLANATSSKTKKKYQLNRYGFSQTLNAYDIGYNSHIPLFLFSALIHISAESASNKAPSASQKSHVVTSSERWCVCGDPIDSWHLLGMPTHDELYVQRFSFKNKHDAANRTLSWRSLPSCLCEHCYRSLFQDISMRSTVKSNMQLCPWQSPSPIHETLLRDSRKAICALLQSICPNVQLDSFSKTVQRVFHDLDIVPTLPALDMNLGIASMSSPESTPQNKDFYRQRPLPIIPPLSPRPSKPANPSTPRDQDKEKACVDSDRSTRSGSSDRDQNIQDSPLVNSVSSPMNASSASTIKASMPSSMSTITVHTTKVHEESANKNSNMPLSPRQGAEDESVVSGMTKLVFNDDRSISSMLPTTTLTPLSYSEFQDMMRSLWRGTTVNMVYSIHPFVEKTRLLYLRSDSVDANNVLVDRLKRSSSTSPIVEWIHRRALNNELPQLFLGWAHRSEASNLQFDANKCISVQSISHIRVGSKLYHRCLKLSTPTKTIVIQIEDDEKLQRLLRGLTQLVQMISTNFR